MPARKRHLGNPTENHEEQSILEAHVSSFGSSLLPDTSSSRNEESQMKIEEEEKPVIEMTSLDREEQRVEEREDENFVPKNGKSTLWVSVILCTLFGYFFGFFYVFLGFHFHCRF